MKRKKYDARDIIFNGIYGAIIGDALGVPVEFTTREERDKDPVSGFREYGTHNQPKGTWSDDTSMILATMSSIERCNGINYEDIMQSFSQWLYAGRFTPFGEVFDAGRTCEKAIKRYIRDHVDPLLCGGNQVDDNGNGSLMRIIPVALIYASISFSFSDESVDYWRDDIMNETVSVIHNVCALTHAHPRSKIACVLYTSICHELIRNRSYNNEFDSQFLIKVIQYAIDNTFRYYSETAYGNDWYNDEFKEELKKNSFIRLTDVRSFADLPRTEIRSSGYVVDTLEAAIWCLLNSSNYKECILKAVNLGGDTDTIGAVAGGLAGLIADRYYWVEARKELVKSEELYAAINQYEEIFFEPYMERHSDLYCKQTVGYCGDFFTIEDLELLDQVKEEISEKENNYTEKNHPGRDKCDMLRNLRMKIAKANNIELKIEECHNTHSCLGTCPVCDSEINYLESELRKKSIRGEKISVSGLTDDEQDGWQYLWGMDLWNDVTVLDPLPDVEDIFEEKMREDRRNKI